VEAITNTVPFYRLKKLCSPSKRNKPALNRKLGHRDNSSDLKLGRGPIPSAVPEGKGIKCTQLGGGELVIRWGNCPGGKDSDSEKTQPLLKGRKGTPCAVIVAERNRLLFDSRWKGPSLRYNCLNLRLNETQGDERRAVPRGGEKEN